LFERLPRFGADHDVLALLPWRPTGRIYHARAKSLTASVIKEGALKWGEVVKLRTLTITPRASYKAAIVGPHHDHRWLCIHSTGLKSDAASRTLNPRQVYLLCQ